MTNDSSQHPEDLPLVLGDKFVIPGDAVVWFTAEEWAVAAAAAAEGMEAIPAEFEPVPDDTEPVEALPHTDQNSETIMRAMPVEDGRPSTRLGED